MRILIVDDTAIVRHLLRTLLEERGHHVIEAESGEQAISMAIEHAPELITMDVHMPGLNGIQTTREIMRIKPTPILIVSGSACPSESSLAIEGLSAGALVVLEKPTAPWDARHETLNESLLSAVELYGKTPVHRSDPVMPHSTVLPKTITPSLIMIGASAGGPAALMHILKALNSSHFPPIVVIQHIAPGFIQSFADWIRGVSKTPVLLATNGSFPLANHIYLAPDNVQLTLNANGSFQLKNCLSSDNLCPSINHFFLSAAQHRQHNTIAIVLSGMGQDGADGCAALAEINCTVIVQSPETALVDSMPLKAMEKAKKHYVLPPENIAQYLNLCSRSMSS